MKIALVLALCVAAAMAFPQQRNEDIQIVSENNENDGNGNYRFGYALSDGTNRNEQGELKSVTDEEGKPAQAQVVRGTISWTSPEGQLITLNYVADELGYRVEGDAIPK